MGNLIDAKMVKFMAKPTIAIDETGKEITLGTQIITGNTSFIKSQSKILLPIDLDGDEA